MRINAGTGSVNMSRYYLLVGPKDADLSALALAHCRGDRRSPLFEQSVCRLLPIHHKALIKRLQFKPCLNCRRQGLSMAHVQELRLSIHSLITTWVLILIISIWLSKNSLISWIRRIESALTNTNRSMSPVMPLQVITSGIS